MLSTIVPGDRKDSATSSKEGIRAAINETNTPSPLNSSNNAAADLNPTPAADIVTNLDRAKSPEITRVLSPMRLRRTPVLACAPDVGLFCNPRLRHIKSLDSVLSSSSMSPSEASTVCPISVSPHNISLPSSIASSMLTVMPEETNPTAIPLPPSPPPTQAPVDTRFNEHVERPKTTRGHYVHQHQPHLLSPVTEASSVLSVPSLGSSIVDLNADVATAEHRYIDKCVRQNAQIVSSAHQSQVSLGSHASRQSRFRERFSLDGAEHYVDSEQHGGLHRTRAWGKGWQKGRGPKEAIETEQMYTERAKQLQKERKAKTICGRMKRAGKKVATFGRKIGERAAGKFGVWVMTHGMG